MSVGEKKTKGRGERVSRRLQPERVCLPSAAGRRTDRLNTLSTPLTLSLPQLQESTLFLARVGTCAATGESNLLGVG